MSEQWRLEKAQEAIVQLRNAEMFLRCGSAALRAAHSGRDKAAGEKALEIGDARCKAKDAIDKLCVLAYEFYFKEQNAND
jgi:hypothetical protein